MIVRVLRSEDGTTQAIFVMAEAEKERPLIGQLIELAYALIEKMSRKKIPTIDKGNASPDEQTEKKTRQRR